MNVHELLNKIQVELKAPKSQYNKFGKYNYRNCEDILEAVKPLLEGAVLTITDDIAFFGSPMLGTKKSFDKDENVYEVQEDIGARFYVKATATLSYGSETISATAYAREPYSKKGMDEMQITCATSSYARKYALGGLFALDDTKDADATNKHDSSKVEVNVLEKLIPELNKVSVEMTEEEALEYLQKQPEFEGVSKDKILKVVEKKGLPYTAKFIRDRLKGGINE